MTMPMPGRAAAPASRIRAPRPRICDSGILSGTLLLTREGEMPVEFLAPGDHVITRDAGMIRIEAVSRMTRTLRAVFFTAGSLGHTRPESDLILPASQAVLVRDWRAAAMFGRAQAMVPAAALIDGAFVKDLGQREMRLHQLHFASPHVVYAGGMELGCGDDLALQQAA